MKIKLLFIFIVLFINIAQSQNIKKGTINKDRQFLLDKKEITAVDDNGNFIAIRPHRVNGTFKNYYIEYFNGLDFLERKKIETNNTTQILDVFIKNNKAHILIKEHNNQHTSIRFDLFDFDNKKLVQKNLLECEKNGQPNLFNALKHNHNISVNYDENYLLSFPVFDNETIFTYLEYFDNNLISYSKQKIYPNENIRKKNISFLNVKSHNNKAYILYNLLDSNKNNYYQLTESSQSETRNLILPIETDTYELINSKIYEGSYILSGLYSKRKKGAFEGFSYYNVNLDTFKLTSSNLSNFTNEDANRYFIGLFKNNRSIDIKDIFIDKNKNTYIIGQFHTIKKQQIPIGIPIASFITPTLSVFITYNPFSVKYKIYDDIMISKLAPNGELLWDQVFELQQTEKIKSSSNKKDSSYYAFLENNQLNILMNGYINMEKKRLIMKQDKRNSKTNFYNIIIDSKGNINPTIIFPNSDSEILFRAEGIVKNNKSMYNLGQGNMRKQLMKLELNGKIH